MREIPGYFLAEVVANANLVPEAVEDLLTDLDRALRRTGAGA
jgi:hypothetical protein